MNIDNKIIICLRNVSRVFLSYRKENPTIDFTMFDLETLQRQIFGDYDNLTVNYLLQHTNYPLKSIRTILNYIVRGIGEEQGTKETQDIYKILIDNDLLVIDDLIKELFRHKDVVVVGYSKKNIELQHLLCKLDAKNVSYLELSDVIEQVKPTLLEFKTIDEEVRYVFNIILKEDNDRLSKGEPLSKKCIVCNNQEYSSYLKMYADKYKIKLYFNDGESIKDTSIAKELLSRANALDTKDPFAFLSELHTPITYGGLDLIKPIQDLINNYLVCHDKKGNLLKDDDNNLVYVNNLYENLSILLDTLKIKGNHYSNEIIVLSSPEFNPYVDYYVLGAADSFLPRLSKNNELLDDSILIKNKLNPSIIKNIESSSEAEAFVNSKYIKHISYYQTKGKDNVFHTTIVSDEQVIKPNKLNYDYSPDIALAYYSKAKDIETKYNEATFDLAFFDELTNKNIDLSTYDSSFKGLKQNNPDRMLSFSYSSINELYSCPFKYFVNHILHMGEFEEKYGSKLGTFAHLVFENVSSLDFEDAWDKAISKTNLDSFSAKEKIFLNADKNLIKDAYINIQNRFYESGFVKESKTEYRKTYVIKDNELKINGSIDSFIIDNDDNIVILDYKTGEYSKGNQESYELGLNLQLLMYSYMLSLDKQYNDKNIAGIYYCPVISKELNRKSKEYQDSLRLGGLTYNQVIPVGSEFIVSYKDSVKVPLNDNLKLVERKILDASELVKESRFDVMPNSKANPCKYCEYKDLCYKRNASTNKLSIDEESKEYEDEE